MAMNFSHFGPLTSKHIISKNDLIDYCQDKEITKELFDEMGSKIPLGADLLTELLKIGRNDTYIKLLLRTKKINTL